MGNRRTSTGSAGASAKENWASVSSSGYIGKVPNQLKAKKLPVVNNALFSLNFSPPPKRVEEGRANYQEESSRRTFMGGREGGRRSSMFNLEFSPPGKPGWTGLNKGGEEEGEEGAELGDGG